MSVQFGKCNFDGKPVDPEDLAEVRPVLAPYGPDGEGYICKDNLAVLYRAFHTTKESRREVQPHLCPSGAVITWDGRLDNREELIGRLTRETSATSTDLEIVAASYERWGTDSFARLIGDWALSIWDPSTRSLLLAKDFVGTRHLYYAVEKAEVTWCTILDPLVLFAAHPFKLEEEFIAGWLSFFPATHLTPYAGIQAVPPSSFVSLTNGKRTITKYWDFDAGKRIRYHADTEYEEQFRGVFSESVRRRLRSDSPVLAELSGGMDSSAIVCMADELVLAHGGSQAVQTVSYYDDSEPNWDESSYFRIVEAERGRVGCHINVGKQDFQSLQVAENKFAATPRPVYRSREASEQFANLLRQTGSRVVLCGIAGDEVTGGVPTPIPELEDLLARARLRQLASRLKTWALARRKPWFHLLFESAAGFLPAWLSGTPEIKHPAPWLNPGFSNRNRSALLGYPRRVKLFGPLPSLQENIATLEALRRQLTCDMPSSEPLFEARYPYLDRGLLEFLFAIPREQLVRPGQRRSLMRRALAGIVPDAIRNRKRKAFVSRTPLATIAAHHAELAAMFCQPVASTLGIADSAAISLALQRARDGQEGRIVQLLRIMEVETWLRQMSAHTALTLDPAGQEQKTQFARQISAHRDSAQLGRMLDNLKINGGQNHGV